MNWFNRIKKSKRSANFDFDAQDREIDQQQAKAKGRIGFFKTCVQAWYGLAALHLTFYGVDVAVHDEEAYNKAKIELENGSLVVAQEYIDDIRPACYSQALERFENSDINMGEDNKTSYVLKRCKEEALRNDRGIQEGYVDSLDVDSGYLVNAFLHGLMATGALYGVRRSRIRIEDGERQKKANGAFRNVL